MLVYFGKHQAQVQKAFADTVNFFPLVQEDEI